MHYCLVSGFDYVVLYLFVYNSFIIKELHFLLHRCLKKNMMLFDQWEKSKAKTQQQNILQKNTVNGGYTYFKHTE